MAQTYADADPEETVLIAGAGRMTLRGAVRAYVAARLRYEHGLMIAQREADKTPPLFHAADFGAMAELERFK